MAIARIDYCKQRDASPPHDFGAIAARVVNNVMADVFSIPMSENYVIAQSHASDDLLHNSANVTFKRLAQIVFIQITLNTGRSPELKAKFYDELTRALCVATDINSEDVYINLVEVAKENWSFGRRCS